MPPDESMHGGLSSSLETTRDDANMIIRELRLLRGDRLQMMRDVDIARDSAISMRDDLEQLTSMCHSMQLQRQLLSETISTITEYSCEILKDKSALSSQINALNLKISVVEAEKTRCELTLAGSEAQNAALRAQIVLLKGSQGGKLDDLASNQLAEIYSDRDMWRTRCVRERQAREKSDVEIASLSNKLVAIDNLCSEEKLKAVACSLRADKEDVNHVRYNSMATTINRQKEEIASLTNEKRRLQSLLEEAQTHFADKELEKEVLQEKLQEYFVDKVKMADCESARLSALEIVESVTSSLEWLQQQRDVAADTLSFLQTDFQNFANQVSQSMSIVASISCVQDAVANTWTSMSTLKAFVNDCANNQEKAEMELSNVRAQEYNARMELQSELNALRRQAVEVAGGVTDLYQSLKRKEASLAEKEADLDEREFIITKDHVRKATMAVASSDSRVLLSSVEATLVEKIVSAFSNAIRYSQETIVVFRNFSSKFVNYRDDHRRVISYAQRLMYDCHTQSTVQSMVLSHAHRFGIAAMSNRDAQLNLLNQLKYLLKSSVDHVDAAIKDKLDAEYHATDLRENVSYYRKTLQDLILSSFFHCTTLWRYSLLRLGWDTLKLYKYNSTAMTRQSMMIHEHVRSIVIAWYWSSLARGWNAWVKYYILTQRQRRNEDVRLLESTFNNVSNQALIRRFQHVLLMWRLRALMTGWTVWIRYWHQRCYDTLKIGTHDWREKLRVVTVSLRGIVALSRISNDGGYRYLRFSWAFNRWRHHASAGGTLRGIVTSCIIKSVIDWRKFVLTQSLHVWKCQVLASILNRAKNENNKVNSNNMSLASRLVSLEPEIEQFHDMIDSYLTETVVNSVEVNEELGRLDGEYFLAVTELQRVTDDLEKEKAKSKLLDSYTQMLLQEREELTATRDQLLSKSLEQASLIVRRDYEISQLEILQLKNSVEELNLNKDSVIETMAMIDADRSLLMQELRCEQEKKKTLIGNHLDSVSSFENEILSLETTILGYKESLQLMAEEASARLVQHKSLENVVLTEVVAAERSADLAIFHRDQTILLQRRVGSILSHRKAVMAAWILQHYHINALFMTMQRWRLYVTTVQNHRQCMQIQEECRMTVLHAKSEMVNQELLHKKNIEYLEYRITDLKGKWSGCETALLVCQGRSERIRDELSLMTKEYNRRVSIAEQDQRRALNELSSLKQLHAEVFLLYENSKIELQEAHSARVTAEEMTRQLLEVSTISKENEEKLRKEVINNVVTTEKSLRALLTREREDRKAECCKALYCWVMLWRRSSMVFVMNALRGYTFVMISNFKLRRSFVNYEELRWQNKLTLCRRSICDWAKQRCAHVFLRWKLCIAGDRYDVAQKEHELYAKTKEAEQAAVLSALQGRFETLEHDFSSQLSAAVTRLESVAPERQLELQKLGNLVCEVERLNRENSQYITQHRELSAQCETMAISKASIIKDLQLKKDECAYLEEELKIARQGSHDIRQAYETVMERSLALEREKTVAVSAIHSQYHSTMNEHSLKLDAIALENESLLKAKRKLENKNKRLQEANEKLSDALVKLKVRLEEEEEAGPEPGLVVSLAAEAEEMIRQRDWAEVNVRDAIHRRSELLQEIQMLEVQKDAMNSKIEADAARLDARIGPVEDLAKALRYEKHRSNKLEEQLTVTQRDLWSAVLKNEDSDRKNDIINKLTEDIRVMEMENKQLESKFLEASGSLSASMKDMNASWRAEVAEERSTAYVLRDQLDVARINIEKMSLENVNLRRTIIELEEELKLEEASKNDSVDLSTNNYSTIVYKNFNEWCRMWSSYERRVSKTSTVVAALPPDIGVSLLKHSNSWIHLSGVGTLEGTPIYFIRYHLHHISQRERAISEVVVNYNIRHPNIVPLIGAGVISTADGETAVLAFECFKTGSLRDVLLAKSLELNPWDRVSIALDITNAIVYLHTSLSPALVHGDICTSKIMLSQSVCNGVPVVRASLALTGHGLPLTAAVRMTIAPPASPRRASRRLDSSFIIQTPLTAALLSLDDDDDSKSTTHSDSWGNLQIESTKINDENLTLTSDFALASSSAEPPITDSLWLGRAGYTPTSFTLTGELTEDADLYALGVCLLQLITGRGCITTADDGSSVDLVSWAMEQIAHAPSVTAESGNEERWIGWMNAGHFVDDDCGEWPVVTMQHLLTAVRVCFSLVCTDPVPKSLAVLKELQSASLVVSK